MTRFKQDRHLTRNAQEHRDAHGADPRAPPPHPGMTFDPVCAMWVDPATAPAQSEHAGRTVSFCAPGCKVAFDKDPARFAAKLP